MPYSQTLFLAVRSGIGAELPGLLLYEPPWFLFVRIQRLFLRDMASSPCVSSLSTLYSNLLYPPNVLSSESVFRLIPDAACYIEENGAFRLVLRSHEEAPCLLFLHACPAGDSTLRSDISFFSFFHLPFDTPPKLIPFKSTSSTTIAFPLARTCKVAQLRIFIDSRAGAVLSLTGSVGSLCLTEFPGALSRLSPLLPSFGT